MNAIRLLRLRNVAGRVALLGLGGFAALLSPGCVAPGAGMTYQEQEQTKQRALNLLLRAAENGDGVTRSNAIEALVDVNPGAGGPLFRQALDADVIVVRYAGCVALGQARDRSALGTIRRRLDDPDPRVRLAAAFALSRLGDTRPARLLVDTLNASPDENLRADAAYLIGKIGDARAAKRLRLAAAREKSNKVLMHLYTALALLKDPTGLTELINASQGDTVSRLIALQGLAEVASPNGAEALLYRLKDESDYIQTRLIAARGLGKLGRRDGFALSLNSLRFKDENPTETMSVRVNAALALALIGDARALAPLRTLAENDSDPQVQVAACYAICKLLK